MKAFFELDEHGTDVRTEVLAGVTTFLTMSYILVVNPDILSVTGMDKGALLTVTCLTAGLATLVMALWTNYPFALAPGMGLNAFFAFTVVKQMGYSWETALAAVFLEGLLFIALTLLNVRDAIVDSIPLDLKHAVGAGIGLFITFIGLKNAGLVVAHPATLVALGPLTPTIAGPAGAAVVNPALVALVGLFVTGVLVAREVEGGLLWGMLATAGLGWITGAAPLPSGVIGAPPSPAPLFGKLDLGAVFSGRIVELIPVVFAFFFVDFFDTLGTLVGVSAKAGLLDEEGRLPNAKGAFMADALGTTFGAFAGTSTVTTYIESASGVKAGGRTGLTSLTTAVLFLLSPFLAPLILGIPGWATTPVLVVVGLHMMEGVREIDLADPAKGLAAFLCIVMMPFTFSISDGIIFGVLGYTLVQAGSGKAREVPALLWVLSVIFVAKLTVG